MKVLVGICCGGTVHAQTLVSLVSALNHLRNQEISYNLSIQIGGDKPRGMNLLAKEMLAGGFTHLMSIDNDMIFPADGIARLLDNDKDIVGANYSVRGNAVKGHPRECVIKMADKNGKRINMPFADLPKELFKCNALGNGFTLYKREVFEKLPAPLFYNKELDDGEWATEDVNICVDAQEKGFEVWCNPKIKMGHIGTFNYEV